jgi:hypothetical protein
MRIFYLVKKNNGLFRQTLEQYIYENREDITLSEITDAISFYGYTPDDCGFDLDDYKDEILRYNDASDYWDYIKDTPRDVEAMYNLIIKSGFKGVQNLEFKEE